jgi:hypothetical protein
MDVPTQSLQRSFAVRSADEARACGLRVEGLSFEDAALHFLEDRHVDGDGEVHLMVEDCASGEQQCFRIDLETGESAPC